MKETIKKLVIIVMIALAACLFAACVDTSEVGTENGNDTTSETEVKTVKVYCGENSLEIELSSNPSAKAFAERLKQGDVTVTMDDYGDFEKVGDLGFELPQSNSRIVTSPGDVILYLGTNITIYYDTNSYNFTLLGKIKGMTRESMLDFFGGKGAVTVTFKAE